MPNLFDFKVVLSDIADIIQYLPVTIELTIVAMIFGLILGLIFAIIQIEKVQILKQLTAFFISIIRGTPIIVQLYATYFGIPIILKYINYYHGTNFNVAKIPPIIFAIVALALNQSAYNAVTIKASLEAVEKGQIEAAHSLGMNSWQALRRIIIPEAIELAIPSLGNTLIGLIKGTSLAFSCAVVEMTAQGKILSGRTYRYFESYVALAIIYWIITIVVEQVIKLIENKIKVPEIVDNGSLKKSNSFINWIKNLTYYKRKESISD